MSIVCCSKARSAGLWHQKASDLMRCRGRQGFNWRPGRADSSIWRFCKFLLL